MSDTLQEGLPVWTVGDRLAKARVFADLTQEQMAQHLDIGRRSIVRYESSDHPPRSIVLAYSAVTRVPLWWFEPEEELRTKLRITAGYDDVLDELLVAVAA